MAELRSRVEQIENELDGARAESDRLRDVISERERQLRSSEQQAYAERALRSEVEQALAAKTRVTGHDLRVLHDHVADLERDLARMRRTVDEAQHLAAAADAARADAERRLAQRPLPAVAEPMPQRAAAPNVDGARARLIAAELERATAVPAPSPAPAPAIVPVRDVDRVALGLERAMVDRRPGRSDAELRVVALERELIDARRELERQRLLCERAYDAIARVRGELAQIGAAVPPEPAARAAAPSEPGRPRS